MTASIGDLTVILPSPESLRDSWERTITAAQLCELLSRSCASEALFSAARPPHLVTDSQKTYRSPSASQMTPGKLKRPLAGTWD